MSKIRSTHVLRQLPICLSSRQRVRSDAAGTKMLLGDSGTAGKDRRQREICKEKLLAFNKCAHVTRDAQSGHSRKVTKKPQSPAAGLERVTGASVMR